MQRPTRRRVSLNSINEVWYNYCTAISNPLYYSVSNEYNNIIMHKISETLTTCTPPTNGTALPNDGRHLKLGNITDILFLQNHYNNTNQQVHLYTWSRIRKGPVLVMTVNGSMTRTIGENLLKCMSWITSYLKLYFNLTMLQNIQVSISKDARHYRDILQLQRHVDHLHIAGECGKKEEAISHDFGLSKSSIR